MITNENLINKIIIPFFTVAVLTINVQCSKKKNEMKIYFTKTTKTNYIEFELQKIKKKLTKENLV